ncbi:hypothetical protein NliqN6_6013 [Naganishia liquefaciens]|uniref:C2H2-type domain-containing protein n=1 Tax=Naganishia liquefaciens TaxID=104408 RepID=A0A8H3TXW8_9TREE|nr:hypothetical protein NliqN6_6013 [Naganishia liquefaciens]
MANPEKKRALQHLPGTPSPFLDRPNWKSTQDTPIRGQTTLSAAPQPHVAGSSPTPLSSLVADRGTDYDLGDDFFFEFDSDSDRSESAQPLALCVARDKLRAEGYTVLPPYREPDGAMPNSQLRWQEATKQKQPTAVDIICSPTAKRRITCVKCPRQFGTLGRLVQHIKTDHPGSFRQRRPGSSNASARSRNGEKRREGSGSQTASRASRSTAEPKVAGPHSGGPALVMHAVDVAESDKTTPVANSLSIGNDIPAVGPEHRIYFHCDCAFKRFFCKTDSLLGHLERCHKEQPWKCTTCKREFLTKSGFKNHLEKEKPGHMRYHAVPATGPPILGSVERPIDLDLVVDVKRERM